MTMKIYALIILGILISTISYAQVTIGSSNKPKRGALLDLNENNNKGVNSTRGLLMPRVALEKEKELTPCILGITSTNEKLNHTGLILFNTSTIQEEGLCPGLYLWTGIQWRKVHGKCDLLEIKNLRSSYVTDGLEWSFDIESNGKWTTEIDNSQGVIQGAISSTKGDGYATIKFTTAIISTANTSTPEYLTSTITFVSESGTLKKVATIRGEKMYINALSEITVDPDGYIKSSSTPTTQVTYTSNSSRTLSTSHNLASSFATFNNDVLDVSINNDNLQRSGTITVSNSVMNKDIRVVQDALTFQSSSSISFAASGGTRSLGVSTSSTRRAMSTSINQSWLSVPSSYARSPQVTATVNTGAARAGQATTSLYGQVTGKVSVQDKFLNIAISQEKGTPPAPLNLMFWRHWGFGNNYSERNASGFFSPTEQIRSNVFLIQGTVGGEPIRAEYKSHWPTNPAIIMMIGMKEQDGYEYPMFDINGNCEINYEDQFGNKYQVRVYPQ